MKNNKMPTSKAKTAYSLLSDVRRIILEEPKRYNQGAWFRPIMTVRTKDRPACNTIACVGGWVCTLTNGSIGVFTAARDVLGLTNEQARQLFYSDAVTGVAGTDQYAADGARHIRAFQKKYTKRLKAKKVRS